MRKTIFTETRQLAEDERRQRGARDTPEEALANLLQALEDLGLITDSTIAT